MRILILEDCEEQQILMGACLADRFPQFETYFDIDANSFCERVEFSGLEDVVLIA